jgi:branched-chain amino acid transport system substrate-binding protein
MNAVRFLASRSWIAAAALGAFAGCAPSVPSTVTIGVAQPLSGTSAARGQDLLNGAKLAVAELNAKGFSVGGKTVQFEVVAHDDKGDKETAKRVAQQLVDQKVTAVIGHLSSDVTEATIPIYKKGNVPQLFTSSAAELVKLGEGNAFRLVANDDLQAKAIAGFVAESLKANKVAAIYEDTTFGAPMTRDATAALAKQGKKVELSVGVNNKATEFGEFVAKLKTAQPDVLLAVLRDHQLIPLFEQMNAAGLGALPVIATSVARTERLARARPDVEMLYLTSGSLDAREFNGGADFIRKFHEAYKSEPVWAAHYAYDAVYVLAHTLQSINSAEPDALRKRLHTIDAHAPVTSFMRFDAIGEQRYGAIAVYQRRESRWAPLLRSDQW